MKLGPRSKLDMRSTLTSKKLNDNVFSKNYEEIWCKNIGTRVSKLWLNVNWK